MTLNIIQGDLFDPELGFDAIAHGVNCKGIMGAGIAKAFRERYPEMYDVYQQRCAKFGSSLAGLYFHYEPDHTASIEADEDGVEFLMVNFPATVYNLFTQVYPGANASLSLVEKAAIAMRCDVESYGLKETIGLPWIGCGIGGLKRHNVHHVLKYVLEDSHKDFVIVEQP